jgi:hypothetical protein
MKLMPRATIGRIANVSVWEVLRRSIFTSVITLLPIAALFIFGGSTLQDFAFAILVGISVGAVSTIFIATPLLVGLMERDPEYARRRDEEPLPGQDEEAAEEAILVAAEAAAAAEPVPDLSPVAAVERAVSGAEAKRERRRQRRSSRPHGRAR